MPRRLSFPRFVYDLVRKTPFRPPFRTRLHPRLYPFSSSWKKRKEGGENDWNNFWNSSFSSSNILLYWFKSNVTKLHYIFWKKFVAIFLKNREKGILSMELTAGTKRRRKFSRARKIRRGMELEGKEKKRKERKECSKARYFRSVRKRCLVCQIRSACKAGNTDSTAEE